MLYSAYNIGGDEVFLIAVMPNQTLIMRADDDSRKSFRNRA